MNLRTKKQLAARAFNVGKERIIFVNERLDEIKEAITKQDMKDLHKEGAVKIREVSGRKTVKKKKSRSPGNIRKKARSSKRDYMIMTRKLRKYAKDLKMKGELSKDEFAGIRKKIRNKAFKSKAHMKEYTERKNKFSAPSKKKSAGKRGSKK